MLYLLFNQLLSDHEGEILVSHLLEPLHCLESLAGADIVDDLLGLLEQQVLKDLLLVHHIILPLFADGVVLVLLHRLEQ